MAGHSQFKNIMHRKGAQDAKRGKIFTRIIREITVSIKNGSPDPAANPRLRTALQMAREENMPRDNIERAIKKATDPMSGDNYEEIRYEGYAGHGVAVIVEALTDNRNRTASDVRSGFAKFGGNLGETGSVSFMFDHVGLIEYPLSIGDYDTVFEAAVNAGCEGLEQTEKGYELITTKENLGMVREDLEKKYGSPKTARLVWQPQTTVTLDADMAAGVLKLMHFLDDHDDIQHVYANYSLDEGALKALGHLN
jgi:YebC/PmpR family DNA-binding regulatory protein